MEGPRRSSHGQKRRHGSTGAQTGRILAYSLAMQLPANYPVILNPYGLPYERPDQDDPGKRPAGMDFFYQIPQVELLSGWTTKKAKQLAAAHDMGFFNLSARMYYAMLNDPHVIAACIKRLLAFRQLAFEIVPGDGRGAKRLARKFAQHYSNTMSLQVGAELFILGVIMGFGIAQPSWGYWYENDETFYPKVQSWHPQLLQYLPFAQALSGSSNPGQLISYVLGSEEGGFRSVATPIYVGTGQWVQFAMIGGDKPWLYGALRAIWRPWIQRLLDQANWIRFNDVHGMPIRAAEVPIQMSKTPQARRFRRQLQNMGSDTSLYLPQPRDKDSPGVKLSLIEARSRSFTSFADSRRDGALEIDRAIMGGSGGAENQRGDNYKKDGERADIRHELKAADALTWAHMVNAQLAVPFAVLNGYDASAAPRVVPDVRPPINRLTEAKAAGENFAAILQAVKAVQEMERLGYSMPLEDLLHSQGIDLPATLEIVERINDGASRPQNDEKRKTSRRLEHPVTRGLPVYRFAQQGGAPLRVQRASRLPSLDSEIRHLAKLRKQLQDELRAA